MFISKKHTDFILFSLHFLSLPICFALSCIFTYRHKQYHLINGNPNMGGIFILYELLAAGCFITLISLLLRVVYLTNINKIIKLIIKIITYVILIPITILLFLSVEWH